MSDSVFIGQNTSTLKSSPKQAAYTGVIINTSDETYVSAGDVSSASAVVLEVSADWATAADVQRILSALNGFEYQPYEAQGALIDPAAELGDALTVGSVYGGIYTQDITFSALMASDVSAPQEQQIDNEYKFIPPQQRQYKRQFKELRASIDLTATQIRAEVGQKLDKEGGDQSFSWELSATEFLLKNNGNTVFKADGNGIEVKGKVTAETGYIGTASQGFAITASAFMNGMTSLSDTSHNGVYVGTDGIALGGGAFKVDAYGNLTANSGTFLGEVAAGNINYGGSYGTFNGGGITGGTIGTGQTSSYINGGISDGYFAGDVFSGAAIASHGNFSSFRINWSQYTPQTFSFRDGLGNNRSFTALMPASE